MRMNRRDFNKLMGATIAAGPTIATAGARDFAVFEEPVPELSNFERAAAFTMGWEGPELRREGNGKVTRWGLDAEEWARHENWYTGQSETEQVSLELYEYLIEATDERTEQWWHSNIAQSEARDLYRLGYWLPFGCDKMPWPLCAVALDAGIVLGVDEVRRLLAETPPRSGQMRRNGGSWLDLTDPAVFALWAYECFSDGPTERFVALEKLCFPETT